MINLLREKLVVGEKTIGTFHEIGSSSAIEALAYSGLDYVLIDTEHGPFDVESTQSFIRAAKGAEFTPLVRVKDGNRNSILKMLDVGAMGLVIPNIHHIEEIHQLVSYGKYHPIGNRGVAPTSGSSFWFAEYAQQGLDHYFEVSNRETLLLPQCETIGCLEDIENIVQVDGVDGIFVGPYDLSTALGKPGQLEDPEVVAAIKKFVAVCKANNKFSFIYAGAPETAKKYYSWGYDSVTYSMDAIVLKQAFTDTIQTIMD